ncbi:zinc finger CCHC domain-containing protein 3 [Huso huso]|uniref:Zinc finger CCHC domain-containing protein 3 n=1 Tax=Huso huso TaxID=61971 RepID=A0ABR0Y3L8_HUSHU
MSAFGVRRNAIRFELLNDLAMDRLEFSRNVLQKGLGFHPRNLDFIFAFPGKKTFEVIFSTFAMFEVCLEKFKKFGDQFKNIAMVPLTRRELKVIHVVMFSELVQYEDILTWLSQYCDVIVGSTVKDDDGVKTGERKFQAKLRRDIVSGDYKHLPNTIQIGSCRGYVFYMGQPKVCRSCGQTGHFSANCDQKFCRNCGAFGHFSNECKLPLKCNLCGESNHVFRDCPFAYANRVKKQRAVNLSEKPTESSAEVDPEPTSVLKLPVEGLGLENLFQEPESEPGPKLDPEPESAPVSETTEDCINSLALEEISCARQKQLVCTEGLALLPVGTLVGEDCRTVWRNVSASYLLNAHRDLAWSVVHQCLPLRSFLYRRGGTASPVCIRPGCWGEETVHHLMWSCSFAQEVWQKMCIWLEKIERKIILTEHGILYGLLGIKISKEKFCKIWSIINSTKDALWKARNILQWKKCDLPAEAVYALALSVAKDYVARDVVHRSREDVSKIWGLEKEQMVSQIVLRC